MEQKNVGIWIRVSTDMQVEGESPEHHERRAKMYAEAKGWNVITIYRLDGLSGKSVLEYQETKRMLKDIKDGTISGIIFSKLARLARNTKELLDLAEIFRGLNADLISLGESIDTSTPSGRMFYTMIASMAQWEREEIAERVKASVPIRAKMGKSLGGAAQYGYKWEGNEFIIDEKEAPVRKLLYEIFLRTRRKKSTSKELNELGYRTRNGSKFSDTTVGRLLRDTTAKGLRIANYTRSLGEKKHWVIKPESEWIKTSCPSIVSEEIWNECNSILDQQEKKRSPAGPRTKYLLAGYVHCACTSKMYVYTRWPVYKCQQCKRKIAASDLDEIYHDQLKSFLLTDTDIGALTTKSQTAIEEKESLLKSVSSEYSKLKKRLEDQMNLRLDGELSKEDFAAFYNPAQLQLRQIEAQLPELEAEIDFLKIQYLSSDTIISEAKDLYDRWPQLPFEEKRTIIETITQSIVIDTDTINIKLSYQPTPNHPKTEEKGNAGTWIHRGYQHEVRRKVQSQFCT